MSLSAAFNFVDSFKQQCLLAIAIILVIPRIWQYVQRLRAMPPGPRGLPLIGNVLQVPKSMPWFQFTKWRKDYGPLFSLNMAGQPLIVLNTFKSANDLLERRSNIYSDRPRFIVVDEFLTGSASLAFTPYGSVMRRLRRAAHVGFNQRAASRYQPQQRREAIYTAMSLLDLPESWEQQIKRMALSSIIGSIYDVPLMTNKDEDTPFIKRIFTIGNMITLSAAPGAYLVEFFPALKYLPSWLAKWKRVAIKWHEEQTEMFESFHKGVQEKLSGNSNPCFIGDLTDNQETLKLSKVESAWLPGMLFLAGAETTAATLLYFFLAMVLYPDTMRKAHDELDQVVGRKRAPTSSDIESLPYIKAMAKEVLRWRPPAPMGIPHRAIEDDWYEGHLIPKGSIVMSNVWAINSDPDVYSDPGDFKPDRHLEGLPQRANPLGHSTFGFGRRICAGMHYATHTLCISIAVILWGLKIERDLDGDGNPIIPPAEEFVDYGLTVGTRPFKCRVLPRFSEARDILDSEFKRLDAINS